MVQKKKWVEDGVVIHKIAGQFHDEYYITAMPDYVDQTTHDFLIRAAQILARLEISVIYQQVFAMATAVPQFESIFGQPSWPVSWATPQTSNGRSLVGTFLFGVSGLSVQECGDDQWSGSRFETPNHSYCFLGNTLAGRGNQTYQQQTKSVFESMPLALKAEGMDSKDIIRTWFYNDDILSWYDDFNKIRNECWEHIGIFTHAYVPASTGIGAGNPNGTALSLSLLAVRNKQGGKVVTQLSSPLQSSARDYGSSFSRAVELCTDGIRRIYVSGTASIDKTGSTVFIDDIDMQIQKTVAVLDALLKKALLAWTDVVQSVVYLRDAQSRVQWESFYKENKCDFTHIVVENTVCRNNLLFEIELMAVQEVQSV